VIRLKLDGHTSCDVLKVYTQIPMVTVLGDVTVPSDLGAGLILSMEIKRVDDSQDHHRGRQAYQDGCGLAISWSFCGWEEPPELSVSGSDESALLTLIEDHLS
jgi:hypothetical protein